MGLQGIALALGLPVSAAAVLIIFVLACIVYTVIAVSSVNWNDLAADSIFMKSDCYSQFITEAGVCSPDLEAQPSVYLSDMTKMKLRTLFPDAPFGVAEFTDYTFFIVAGSVSKNDLMQAELIVRQAYLSLTKDQIGTKRLITLAEDWDFVDLYGRKLTVLSFKEIPQRSLQFKKSTIARTRSILFRADMMQNGACSVSTCESLDDITPTSVKPTSAPTNMPTMAPTMMPTMMPTMGPTMGPTYGPTYGPTSAPPLV